jgi:cyclopropane-fatty-acyl-phospholipid synthase
VLSQFVAPGKASFLRQIVEGTGISCEIVFASGEVERFGPSAPQFTLHFKNDRSLRYGFDEFAFADAFVNGDIEVQGDLAALLQLRTRIKDRVRFSAWLKFIRTLLFKHETAVNREAISDHYQHGDELYLSFIDKRYRFYSQGIFHSEHESLEDASEHKLENMYRALQLQPGMRLLDIGGGWGGVAQYCGNRGVHVTELTLAPDSYRYISDLIRVHDLPCEVLLEDFLSYEPAQPFDAIVIYGVIEHIINYQSFCEQVWKCLRPNGRLFLDASASIVKYDVSGFARKYIWSGTHTFLCLQDLIAELLFHGMELLRVDNESAHYGRTMLHWARRLEESRDLIVARWGEKLYRAFRLYLWGGSQAFPELLQAYSLVAQRMERRRPVAGRWRRMLGWVGR